MIKNTQGGILGRTRRYIFTTLTVVSLLLLLVTVGLWVDSYDEAKDIDLPHV